MRNKIALLFLSQLLPQKKKDGVTYLKNTQTR